MGVRVECYAGHRSEETPRRLHLDDRSVKVVAVLERWRTPEERGFRVRADDGRSYRLVHDEASGEWRAEEGAL